MISTKYFFYDSFFIQSHRIYALELPKTIYIHSFVSILDGVLKSL